MVGGVPSLLSRRRWAVAAALVAVVLALHAIVPWLFERGHARPTPVELAFGLVELPIALLALCVTYRWSTQRRLGWLPTLVSTLAVSIAVAAAAAAVMLFAMPHAGVASSGLLSFGRLSNLQLAVLVGSVVGVMQCGIWALAFVYPFAADESRIRALEADKLRTWAELARLRSQLEPHFLLNTLNAIAGLVTEEPREARRLLACLGDLLRDALVDSDELQTVDREVAWLRRYAEILESRYSGTLSFHWKIADGVGAALIPRLLLQPLIENAVKHGALRRESDGLVAVGIKRVEATSGTKLVCSVRDNGPGTAPAREPSTPEGFGLRAVRRRLELKYGDATLLLRSSPNGTEAIVELPLEIARLACEPATKSVQYVEKTS